MNGEQQTQGNSKSTSSAADVDSSAARFSSQSSSSQVQPPHRIDPNVLRYYQQQAIHQIPVVQTPQNLNLNLNPSQNPPAFYTPVSAFSNSYTSSSDAFSSQAISSPQVQTTVTTQRFLKYALRSYDEEKAYYDVVSIRTEITTDIKYVTCIEQNPPDKVHHSNELNPKIVPSNNENRNFSHSKFQSSTSLSSYELQMSFDQKENQNGSPMSASQQEQLEIPLSDSASQSGNSGNGSGSSDNSRPKKERKYDSQSFECDGQNIPYTLCLPVNIDQDNQGNASEHSSE